MSDDTGEETGPDEVEDPPSRIAGAFVLLVLAGVLVLILRVVVTVAPYSAYFVVGVLVTVGWQRAAGWLKRRREDRAEPEEEEEELDVVEALQRLGRNGDNVLLTQLRKRLGAKDTKAVRKLLKAEKIRVRPGVRTPAGNGPGVHREDIPAPPPRTAAPSVAPCSCRSATTPTPTAGITTEPIGLAGIVVKDGSEVTRQHRV
jgi:hypothetical protein